MHVLGLAPAAAPAAAPALFLPLAVVLALAPLQGLSFALRLPAALVFGQLDAAVALLELLAAAASAVQRDLQRLQFHSPVG